MEHTGNKSTDHPLYGRTVTLLIDRLMFLWNTSLLVILFSAISFAAAPLPAQRSAERIVADAIPVVVWLPQTFSLSPDSHRTAYVVDARLNEYAVVLDGKLGKSYPPIGKMRWSPNSQHFVYEVCPTKDKCTFLVIDGAETRTYDRILSNTVSFLGNDTLRYLAVDESRVVSVDVQLGHTASP
jgi:hypothetical protein